MLEFGYALLPVSDATPRIDSRNPKRPSLLRFSRRGPRLAALLPRLARGIRDADPRIALVRAGRIPIG